MSISAKDVKALRDKTGAGMMDCKKALNETGGDIDKAVLFLREKGLAGVQKRAGRIASEGTVACVTNDNRAVMVEINSETDFVAKNEDFKAYAVEVAEHVLSTNNHDDKEVEDAAAALADESWYKDQARKVSDIFADQIATIGENLKMRRFVNYVAKNGAVATYIHGGGRIGVMVEYSTDNNSDALFESVRDVAMHVAAINPHYLSKDVVTQEDLDRERELYRKTVLNEGKPEKIVDKIVDGKMKKFYSEVCLLEQPFVKEPKQSVREFLAAKGKELGATVDIVRYVRYQVGEGLGE